MWLWQLGPIYPPRSEISGLLGAVAAPGATSIANAKSGLADLIVQSVDELPEVDAYIVAVPTFLHGEVLLKLAGLGVPIYCEKH